MIKTFLDIYSVYKEHQVPVDAILRAFHTECEANLGVLKLVDLEKDSKDASHQDPALIDAALKLETEMLRIVLGGTDQGEKVAERLRRVRFVLPEDADMPIDPMIQSEPPAVEESVRRLAVAVGSVQAAAALLREDAKRTDRSARLRNIRPRQRLHNLAVAYGEIAAALRHDPKLSTR